jgi:hypothetical protein
VDELVDECLATGLSVERAEQRLLDQVVCDLQLNNPDVYARVSQDAAAQRITVADLLTRPVAAERRSVEQRAQYELDRLRRS